jgi:protease PrsW
MADVSPGGVPDQGATPPAPEVFPASTVPADPQPLTAAQPASAPGYAFPPSPAYSPSGGFPSPPTEAVATAPDSWRDPATGRARHGWRRWVPIAVVITLILAGAIGMLLFLGVNFGGVALAVGLVAAVIPVPLLVAAFFWLDRYEPEPIHLLAFCFAWGATVATSVALLVNTGAAWLFDKAGLSESLVAVLIAPLIEESMKASGPLLLFWRRREEWSGITDGIVYCGLSALGFAMVENVLYLGGHGYAAGAEQYGAATGLQNVFAIFIVRILFTGFAHPLFTSMTGIGLGISSRSGDRRVRWLAPIAGLLVAMMLHGTFNLLPTLSVSLSQPFIMLYGYLGFMVPFFFAVVGFAIALRGWEGRIAERVLPFYVRTGWFAPPEVAALGSLGRRYSARQWARRVAGPAGQRAMKSFQFAATQLALLRDGMQRGLHRTPVAVQRASAEEQRLLAAIVDYRSTFTGRDPQMPQAFWNGELYQIAFPDGVTRSVNPPEEPVVPVPIRFAQPAYAGYGVTPGYGPSGYGAPSYGAPSYGGPSYGAPSGGAYGGPAPAAGAYGAPASAAPAYGAPASAYGAPNYGAPNYGAPTWGAPAPGAPSYGTPASGTPGYGTPAYGAPGSGTPGYGTPAYGAAASGTPSYGAPASGMPAYGAPGSGTPSYGASAAGGYGAPASGMPAYGDSGSGTPSYGAPAAGGYGAPASGMPAYGAPGPGQPSYGLPGSGTPSFGASASGAPAYGAPGHDVPSYGASLGSGTPSQDTSGYGASLGYAAAGQGETTPTYGAPASGTPAYGTPGQGAPGYGTPGYGAPSASGGAPTYGAPGSDTPTYGAPSASAPAQGGPGYGASDQAAPVVGAPSVGEPSRGASEHDDATAQTAPVQGAAAQSAAERSEPGQGAAAQSAAGPGLPDAQGERADRE